MILDNYLVKAKESDSIAEKSAAWLRRHQEQYSELDRILDGLNELPFSIPIFFDNDDEYVDVRPWHHVFYEAEQDLDDAILSLFHGFYKNCFFSIRSFIELSTFALYHFANNDKKEFQEWLSGNTQTPKFEKMLEVLDKRNKNIHIWSEKTSWKADIVSLYQELSRFIHTRGAMHTHTALRNSNSNSFNENSFEIGISLLCRATTLVSEAFVISFPMSFCPLPLFDKFAFNQPAGGFLEMDQVERIRAMFSRDIQGQLSEVCFSDETAISLSKEINSMRDLSYDEILESFKRVIESEHFINRKEEILGMIREGKIDRAFAMIRAAQRAVMRSLTMLLFNPFYDKKDAMRRP